MAERSFHIQLRNFTDLELRRTDFQLAHGVWSDNGNDIPAETVESVSRDDFASESGGIATGTQGSVTYNSDAGAFVINWDNPFVGSNSFSVQTPPGFDKDFGDISGNQANVRLLVFDS
jgi:hypothetical protein